MLELSPQQRSGITKRNNTRNAFLSTATEIFSQRAYPDVQVADVTRSSGISSATFYSMFTSKGAWAAAVLDERLIVALDQRVAAKSELSRTPYSQLLGHLVLLGDITAPLPGITKALVDERTEAHARPYTDLLPKYYGEVTDAVRDGQERNMFRGDIEAPELAAFALDSLAMAYAVPLGDTLSRTTTAPYLVLDGLKP